MITEYLCLECFGSVTIHRATINVSRKGKKWMTICTCNVTGRFSFINRIHKVENTVYYIIANARVRDVFQYVGRIFLECLTCVFSIIMNISSSLLIYKNDKLLVDWLFLGFTAL